jgi:hypothetical protein
VVGPGHESGSSGALGWGAVELGLGRSTAVSVSVSFVPPLSDPVVSAAGLDVSWSCRDEERMEALERGASRLKN